MNRYLKFGILVAQDSGAKEDGLAEPVQASVGVRLCQGRLDRVGGADLRVVYTGTDLPDTVRDGAQALADGQVGADGVFRANKLQAKTAEW
jgi:hypothetical protein